MRPLVLLLFLLCACSPDPDGDGYATPEDCAPLDPTVFPGAWEACNGRDDDCDGEVDELYDLDGDGFLADDAGCRALGVEIDCDDLDANAHPGAEEVADNGRDDDCDGRVDETPDSDGDGFEAAEDCDDTNPFIYPGAAEACDGLDNDCDGAADEDWDHDGDGVAGCAGDCDDSDPTNSPAIAEACDGRDNDCDGQVDEDFDEDGDGWTTCAGDCDDFRADVHPGAEELCDGVDNDCDDRSSEDGDLDGDGVSWCDGDCDDSDPAIYPGAEETCDGLDDDCNGYVDEFPECWACTALDPWLLCELAASWEDARSACWGFGLDLAVLPTEEDNAKASALAWDVLAGDVWVGLTDADVEGTWRWIDGDLLAYESAWSPGEPNDYGAGEDCGTTNWGAVGFWNDSSCGSALPFLCGP